MSNDPSETEVIENLQVVNERIARAATRATRPVNDIHLIAVSKTKPVELIKAALRAGQTRFGENYVQEIEGKFTEIKMAEWHFIGSLQTNKARFIAGHVHLIHSVDRLSLAEEISKVALKKNVVQDILLQVHVGDENTKHGVTVTDAPALIESVSSLPALRLRGLMALPPLTDDEKQARTWFAQLHESLVRWRANLNRDAASTFNELSIGTTSDFEWAIQEGATLVRVGTAIFGSCN